MIDSGVEAQGGGAVGRDVLVQECRELLIAYLVGGSRGAPEGGQVDFFDVWG